MPIFSASEFSIWKILPDYLKDPSLFIDWFKRCLKQLIVCTYFTNFYATLFMPLCYGNLLYCNVLHCIKQNADITRKMIYSIWMRFGGGLGANLRIWKFSSFEGGLGTICLCTVRSDRWDFSTRCTYVWHRQTDRQRARQTVCKSIIVPRTDSRIFMH